MIFRVWEPVEGRNYLGFFALLVVKLEGVAAEGGGAGCGGAECGGAEGHGGAKG